MMDAIENSAYAIWVRESPSIFAYTSILSLHAIGLAIIVGINYLIALRMLGFVPGIPLPALRKLFPWMYLGFTINLFSGASLLAANLSNDLGNWLFICKLVFILFAMINLELTKTHVFDRPGTVGVNGLPKNAKVFAWGALILWGLAMVAGRFTAYPNFVEAWLGF
jgi:preprotein translocase subunit Sss1